jgi:peptidoglycan/xylan/chitin deacetylase (PgdA/CDA1 family)
LKTEDGRENRRKRINRIKRFIIFSVLLLILLPTIGCIILGIQVARLEKQVDDLNKISGLNRQADSMKDGDYAYAAVKNDTLAIPSILPLLQDSGNTYHKQNSKAGAAEVDFDITTSKNSDKLDDKDKTQDADKTADTVQNKDKADDKNDGIYSGEKIYLTFDDGPSIYTTEILDTLAKYNVKATFFVIGKTDNDSKEIYKRIVNEGHTLGMHSYSHRYDRIYKSVEDFDKDFTKLWKLLYDTTGYKPSIYRFPGGSDNQVSNTKMDDFIGYLNEKYIVYFDWNVVSGDATSKEYTKKQLVDNIIKGVTGKERAIVLMHDSQTKKATADSLPKLIQALIKGGAEILPLDNTVEPIQMIKANQVK